MLSPPAPADDAPRDDDGLAGERRAGDGAELRHAAVSAVAAVAAPAVAAGRCRRRGDVVPDRVQPGDGRAACTGIDIHAVGRHAAGAADRRALGIERGRLRRRALLVDGQHRACGTRGPDHAAHGQPAGAPP